jgi:hypothetical protein
MHLNHLPPRYRPTTKPPTTKPPSLLLIYLTVSPFALLIAYTFANLI